MAPEKMNDHWGKTVHTGWEARGFTVLCYHHYFLY